MRAEWRCAEIRPGVRSVPMDGLLLMLLWCADTWSSLEQVKEEAQLLPRILSFARFLHITGAQAFQGAAFGQGVGPIYLENVACVGTEVDIFDCTATTPTCDHSMDASVRCNFPREY